ncbi:MAG: hypothetical protein AAF762_07030, partial [Pseudomonadota bacterium]
MDGNDIPAGVCPFVHTKQASRGNRDWWPNQLNMKILAQNSHVVDPFGGAFNYADAFKTLDYDALKADLHAL